MSESVYYLEFFGEILNDDLVARDLGIVERSFWFGSDAERSAMKAKIKEVATNRGVLVGFVEREGQDTLKRTVARMKLALPDGRTLDLEHDFGYGYPEEYARFMFEEGNYSCDCNRSYFLADRYPDVQEMECGDLIEMRDLTITRED